MLHLVFLILAAVPILPCHNLPIALGGELLVQTAENRKRNMPWSEAISSTQVRLAVRVETTLTPSPIPTLKPAVVVVGSEDQQYPQLITYPPVFCGFFDIAPKIYSGGTLVTDPDSWMTDEWTRLVRGSVLCAAAVSETARLWEWGWWSGTSTPEFSCTTHNSHLCCASQGSCERIVTSCKPLGGDDYRWGGGEEEDLAVTTCSGDCVTLYNSHVTGFICDTNTGLGVSSRTMYDTSEILQLYAGSTIAYQSDYGTYDFWFYSTMYAASSTTPYISKSSPVEYLNEIGTGGAPSCLNNLSICPKIENATYSCWNLTTFPGPTDCFCQVLEGSSCAGLCNSAGRESGAADYVQWVLNLCKETTFTTTSWPDFQNLSHTAQKEIIPWNWHVQAESNQDIKCYSTSAILGSFALVNFLVCLATIILGRRTVVKRLTFHYLGKPGGSTGWPAMAFLSVALNILANLINALLVKHTPGFEAVPIGALLLLWSTRPRIAWAATVLISVEEEKSMYFSLGATSLLAEIVLQLIGSPYLGMTVDFARKKGYYKAGRMKGIPHGEDALIMYSGALLWLVSIGGFLAYHVGLVFGIWPLLSRGLTTLWKRLTKVWGALVGVGGSVWGFFDQILRKFGRSYKKAQDLTIPYLFFWGKPSQPEEVHSLPRAEQQHFSQKRDEEHTTPRIEVRGNLSTDDILATMGLNKKKLKAITFTPALMILPFIGQWLFWAGFVRLAQDLYCPPPLWSMTTVWTLFSIIGVFFGASH